MGLGARGKMICEPSISASSVGPSESGGNVKFRERPKITGYVMRTRLLVADRYTSACSRNVVVSDQFRIETEMTRAGLEKVSMTTFVKGHGPAMQMTLPS